MFLFFLNCIFQHMFYGWFLHRAIRLRQGTQVELQDSTNIYITTSLLVRIGIITPRVLIRVSYRIEALHFCLDTPFYLSISRWLAKK